MSQRDGCTVSALQALHMQPNRHCQNRCVHGRGSEPRLRCTKIASYCAIEITNTGFHAMLVSLATASANTIVSHTRSPLKHTADVGRLIVLYHQNVRLRCQRCTINSHTTAAIRSWRRVPTHRTGQFRCVRHVGHFTEMWRTLAAAT